MSVTQLGVVGAGTMGVGIAQLACFAGYDTYLTDASQDQLDAAGERLEATLARGVERGRWTADEASAARQRLHLKPELEQLEPCQLVIEAVPERLELKQQLIGRLSEICAPGTVLATNTSSLRVSAIAGAAREPAAVVGLHFFNPPPLMRLLEVVPGVATDPRTVEIARGVGQRMGRETIVVRDGVGFLANRCARPFAGEAMRLLGERCATAEQIDRICRRGGGFRMGPLELVDLIGLDVNFEIARSFYAQSYGEPRWRPSSLQEGLVAAGRWGRKTGVGFHDYPREPEAVDEVAPPEAGPVRSVAIVGETRVASALRRVAVEAGIELVTDARAAAELLVDCRLHGPPDEAPFATTRVVLCAGQTLAVRDPAACGFHLILPLAAGGLVELTRLPTSDPAATDAAVGFFATCGFGVEWVADRPGMVLGRIVAQLVNEAAFAIAEGVGAADDVDRALALGFNHPRGPVEWSQVAGLEHVVAVLDGLWELYREERYRVAPLLRQALALNLTLAELAGAPEA